MDLRVYTAATVTAEDDRGAVLVRVETADAVDLWVDVTIAEARRLSLDLDRAAGEAEQKLEQYQTKTLDR